MSKFNQKRPTTKTTNLAGGKAYRLGSAKDELIFATLSTFLKNSFYEKGDIRIDRIRELVADLVGQDEDVFVAKLAIYARKVFHLRSVSHLLISELSKLHKGDSLVSVAIESLVERPDDMTEILACVGKPIPKQVKLGVAKAFHKFSRYSLAKYKSEKKSISLRDAVILCHPNPAGDSAKKELWKELLDGNLKSFDTWESKLSGGGDKQSVWMELLSENKLGQMALLRNLRNIEKFSDNKGLIELAASSLSDREQIKISKILPFRYYTAYKNVTTRQLLDAINLALETSLMAVPSFGGKTLIAVDRSGSMQGDPIEKAAIFAAALFKKTDSDLILFDTNIEECKVLSNTPTITIADSIANLAIGGGTDTSLVFKYAEKKQIKYDQIFILSDNESWGERNGVKTFYDRYKKSTNANPLVFAIDLCGYGTVDIKGDGVYNVCGWSEKIFDFISALQNKEKLSKIIDDVQLVL